MGREKPCVFCTRIMELLSYMGHHPGSTIKKKKPVLFAPVVPLSFVLAYQMDMAYGTLIYRMRGEAESIMVSEHDRLDLPHGVPNFESIEKARRAKTTLGSLFEK